MEAEVRGLQFFPRTLGDGEILGALVSIFCGHACRTYAVAWQRSPGDADFKPVLVRDLLLLMVDMPDMMQGELPANDSALAALARVAEEHRASERAVACCLRLHAAGPPAYFPPTPQEILAGD